MNWFGRKFLGTKPLNIWVKISATAFVMFFAPSAILLLIAVTLLYVETPMIIAAIMVVVVLEVICLTYTIWYVWAKIPTEK